MSFQKLRRPLLLAVLALLSACRSGEDPKAADDAEKACVAGDAGACETAVRLLEERCYRRETAACARVAKLYLAGRTGRIEKVRAVQAYERGCDAGDGAACNNAGGAYARADLAKAEKYRLKSCDLGYADGCTQAAGLLRDREDPASKAQADALAARAKEIYNKSCAAGDPLGCFGLGMAVRMDSEDRAQQLFREAMTIWQKRCDTGDLYGCYRVGIAYGEESGVPIDYERSKRMLDDACTKGHRDSCAELGHLFKSSDDKSDDARGAELLERACLAGIEERQPCREAGFMFAAGEGVPADKARGIRLLENGCSLGDDWCCFKLGSMLLEGDGVPANPARGAELTESANGLEFRVVEVKRGTSMVDPSLTAFGIPESSLTPTKAAAGQELVFVALEARRTAEKARLPVRKLYLVDAAGRLFENHAPGDTRFGDKPLERREYLFKVPTGTRPIKVKLELGGVTLDLPPVKGA
jgi:TPR repeat protein